MKTWLLVAAVAVLAACGKNQVGELTTEDTISPSQASDGSTVGNGMKEFVSDELSLRFKYPASWTLESDRNHVRLTNANEAGDLASSIDFALLSEIDGHHFSGLEDLRSFLTKKEPEMAWLKTNVNNRNGFWQETRQNDRIIADYYLLDENYNVFRIHLETSPEFEGEQFLRGLLNNLTLDDEGPVVKEVFFEPKAAMAGDKVKLVVIAEDQISGLDANRMGETSRVPSQGTHGGESLGYRVAADGASKAYHLDRAIPLQSRFFRAVTHSRIEYEFTVPKNAPAGRIELNAVKVYDRKGNATEVRLQTTQAFFTVLPSTASDYSPDREGPEFFEAYFEKTFVTARNFKQKLFLRIRDNTKLEDFAVPHFSDYRRGDNSRYMTCTYWEQTLHQVSQDLYFIEGDARKCFDYHEKPNYQLVYLEVLKLYDAIGNFTECYSNPHANVPCKLGKVRFELAP